MVAINVVNVQLARMLCDKTACFTVWKLHVRYLLAAEVSAGRTLAYVSTTASLDAIRHAVIATLTQRTVPQMPHKSPMKKPSSPNGASIGTRMA